MSEVIITVSAYPPSANDLYKRNANGSQRLSKAHKQFRDEIFYSALSSKEIEQYPVEISVYLYMKDKRLRDVDNVNKTVLDGLVKAKVLRDDNWKYVRSVKTEIVSLCPVKQGKTLIRIKKYDGGSI
ncbi:RusA family crossover junction endodeoxyribonuclease [Francisella marina]|uniref:RusA family crossover junction endodeoxyribonuclease n=1 Tax=Francisella marina TaxID=2249302 RepID=UPI0011EBF1E4|nr:RusA family crossover junction endodeoxyribonuclease [Francisella marina]QEO58302.1 RusA family crossover junction endodeoxyribonuclease [Francisella marina]